MEFDWTRGDLAQGLERYEAGEFFEAHEAWENVWKVSPQPEKTFLQALIQVAAAFHHLQKNNSKGTILLMHSALRRLDPVPPNFGGMSVIALRDEIRQWLRALEGNESAYPETPVRIRPQL